MKAQGNEHTRKRNKIIGKKSKTKSKQKNGKKKGKNSTRNVKKGKSKAKDSKGIKRTIKILRKRPQRTKKIKS